MIIFSEEFFQSIFFLLRLFFMFSCPQNPTFTDPWSCLGFPIFAWSPFFSPNFKYLQPFQYGAYQGWIISTTRNWQDWTDPLEFLFLANSDLDCVDKTVGKLYQRSSGQYRNFNGEFKCIQYTIRLDQSSANLGLGSRLWVVQGKIEENWRFFN